MTVETSQPRMGGTDGLRDNMGDDPTCPPGGDDPTRLSAKTAAGLAVAFIETSPTLAPPSEMVCVVGGDTRPSTPLLQEAVVAAADSIGARVIDMGRSPTPGVQWAARRLEAQGTPVATFVVSASHNPARDNGIKFMDGAAKPDDERIRRYSERYWERVASGASTPTENTSIPEDRSYLELYRQALVDSIKGEFGPEPLKGKLFVVDGANGAAMGVAPRVLRDLGAIVEEFACDGSRPINDRSGAAHLEGVKEFMKNSGIVQRPGFMGAVCLDGDGDRLIGVGAHVGEGGEVVFDDIDGNRVMELLAEGQPGIVGTEYTNPATRKRLRERGIPFYECKNGDRYVTEMLRELDLRIGGEFTGHLIDRKWGFGDGVRMAAWLAAYAASQGAQGKTFAQLAAEMPLDHEKMINVRMGRNSSGELNRPDVRAEIEAARAKLGEDGLLIARESGTESKYRIFAAGEDEELVERVAGRIATTLAFPKILAEELATVNIEDLDDDGQDALRQIREEGYDLGIGLRAGDLPEIADIADQREVSKRCPRDSEERFGGRTTPQEERVGMTTEWHTKMRLFIQLRRTIGNTGLAGYGWTGPQENGRITLAARMNEADAGRGIGTLFTRAIVSITRMRTNGASIDLDTDRTNHSVRVYTKAGAILDGEPEHYRRLAGWDEQDKAGPDGKVDEWRQHMVFPATAGA